MVDVNTRDTVFRVIADFVGIQHVSDIQFSIDRIMVDHLAHPEIATRATTNQVDVEQM